MDACTECGYGLTTGPNSTQSSENDCVVAPGFGWVRRSVEPCPIGELGIVCLFRQHLVVC